MIHCCLFRLAGVFERSFKVLASNFLGANCLTVSTSPAIRTLLSLTFNVIGQGVWCTRCTRLPVGLDCSNWEEFAPREAMLSGLPERDSSLSAQVTDSFRLQRCLKEVTV